jgi:D-3-phosphoglycerate dehydrogenase
VSIDLAAAAALRPSAIDREIFMRPRILLTSTPDMRANYYGDRALAELQGLGDVELHEGAGPLDAAGLIARAAGCRIVVADRNTPLPAAVFASLDSVAAVCRVAVDIRNIDVAAASSAGILVTQASRTWVPAVAEMVIGHMIAIGRAIACADRAYKAGVLAPPVWGGRQLAGATCGIIGYGPLGRRVAELALAFGMRVLVSDPYVTTVVPPLEHTDLQHLFAEADFVLPLAVATAETENLIDAAVLARMKPTAYLVNLSRGNLVDEAALVAALDAGRIAGAALDVGRAPDQMPTPAIARRDDVLATPHIAGLTTEAIEGQALETVAQVREILAGRIPAGAVNADRALRLAEQGVAFRPD